VVTVERLQRGIEKATAAGDFESAEMFRRELESIQSIQRRREEGKERRRSELEELRRRAAESSEIFEESKRGSVARGLDIGTDLIAQATGSGLEGIGRVLGLEGLEEYGAEVALENEAEIQRKSRYQTKFDDIEGAGDFFSYLGGVAAESAPATAAGIAGGIAVSQHYAGAASVYQKPGYCLGTDCGDADRQCDVAYPQHSAGWPVLARFADPDAHPDAIGCDDFVCWRLWHFRIKF